MSKGIYNWVNAESVGRRLDAPSQSGVPNEHYRTQTGNVIYLRDTDAVKAESERLDGWRECWLKLACNRDRMRRMGGLQSQQDYIMGRSMRAARARKLLLEALWKVMDKKPLKPVKDTVSSCVDTQNIEINMLRSKLRAADKMAQICDTWVRSGEIDSRSALADARLNYGKPYVYEFSNDES